MVAGHGEQGQSEHEPAAAGGKVEEEAPGEKTIRQKIWEGLDDPSSSRLAYWFSISVLSLILLSCTAFVVETIPSMCCGRYDDVWERIETVCVAVFTFEYLSRFIVVPTNSENEGLLSTTELSGFKPELMTRLRFFIRPLNAVDFAAIFPFYLQYLAPGDTGGTTSFLRVIRLARVFRLFKLSKYSQGMWLLSATMVRSWRALGMLGFFMLISVVLFSSVMYFVERGDYFFCTPEAVAQDLCLESEIGNRTEGQGLEHCQAWAEERYGFPLKCCWGEGWYVSQDANGDGCVDKSQFESIVATAWWCVVTMTTVGYGDVLVHTTLGKVVATATMLSGILILALPITVIGSNFNLEYERTVQEENLRREMEEMQQEQLEAEAEAETAAAGGGGGGLAGGGGVVQGQGSSGQLLKEASGGLSRRVSTEADGTARQSENMNQALLEKVEKLMSEQREAILRRAEALIAQHVREIAKEVVAQSNAGRLNGTARTQSAVSTGSGRGGADRRPSGGRALSTGDAAREVSSADLPGSITPAPGEGGGG